MKRKIINNQNNQRKAIGNIVFKIMVGIAVVIVFGTFFFLTAPDGASDEKLVEITKYRHLVSFAIFAVLLPFASIFWEMMGGIYDSNKIILKIVVCSLVAVGGGLVSLLTWDALVVEISMYISLLSLVFSLIPTIKPEEVKELRENG